jgi:hypothetical protein
MKKKKTRTQVEQNKKCKFPHMCGAKESRSLKLS